MITPVPLMVEPVMMKNIGDCGIVCLVMLTGKSYTEVMAACPKRGKPQHNGLSTRQLQNVAKKLGFPLERKTTWDDDDVGILDLDHESEAGHFVMFGKGTIYNPAQNEWWFDIESYLKQRNFRADALLRRTDK